MEETLQEHGGVGADADLQDEIRFVVGVARLLRKRVERGELDQTGLLPAVFLLHPESPDLNVERKVKRSPMLDNGLQEISNRVWFVNQVANDGTAIQLSEEDDDETIFELVVEELSLGDLPAVIFEPRTDVPEARYYPEGLSKTQNCRPLRIDAKPLSLKEIFEVIDRLYHQQLCTPDVQGRAGKLWEKSDQYWVAENAEDRIQVVVRAGLTGYFPTCLVRVEQPQATGRLDVEIEEPLPRDRSRVTRHAVLELKVLRTRGAKGNSWSDAKIKQWVVDGVEQASSYRNERGCRLAALCCFDMRVPGVDNCFDHVGELAGALKVELKAWRLFASSGEYRHFLASQYTS
ncbi:hypothetical protein [Actinomadura viridis]|uniref:Uncharacterized protein n=1 Tax=Actinomadura viridis TaxID=58110 RepID=A0A931DI10_9ACTN|nr:hypothetical protein [Actinomadura viridis]MBG6087866.1 hypothetical protein [Actinomadura viridis]